MTEMIDYLYLELTNEQTVEAKETNELLLTLGADVGVARTTVAELLPPQIFGTKVSIFPQEMFWT